MGVKAPTPTSGQSVEDCVVDSDTITQDALRQKFAIDASKQVRLVKLAFVEYQHPDLQEITKFLQHFGLLVAKETTTDVWFRGYGEEPYVYHARRGPSAFLGGAFVVESPADLERALSIPDVRVLSSGIEQLVDSPGGGQIVTIQDPEGFPISLVFGQQETNGQLSPEPITLNFERHKPRARKFQRFNQGPAAVYRLGHYGLVVGNFHDQFTFYTHYFNIMPTSILYVTEADGSRKNIGMFAHIERGTGLVDHHSIFLLTRPPHIKHSHVHHCSFEIHDFDTQLIGHDWMLKQGYKPAWGVGRHILGSQIFDYWWDPHGFMTEHYIDGDVVNKETPVSFHPAASAKDAAWGPDVRQEFLE